MSYRPTHIYSFAQKLKESVSEEDLAILMDALKSEKLDEQVEFEKYYNIALAAFNRSKSDTGWSASAVKAPEAFEDKTPKINHSKWLSEDEDGNEQLALNDESCLLYTSPSPRDQRGSRMPSSA